MSTSVTLCEQLLRTARAMSVKGLNQGTSGNASVRTENGLLITPSGRDYEQCSADDMVAMDLDGRWEPDRRPSSEWRFHRDIYRHFAAAGAVLHAHSPWCTALACLERGIPAFHYMVAVAGGTDIRCAPYATFGTQELSDHALKALEDRKACLLAHHGLLVWEDDLPKALALAVEVEHLAQVYVQCLSVAEPATLTGAQMAEVLERFTAYKSGSSVMLKSH